jgi:Flp pilus assembly pilin Flp
VGSQLSYSLVNILWLFVDPNQEQHVLAMFRDFRMNEKGLTMTEYAIIAGLVSVVGVVLLTAMGGSVKNLYSTVNSKLTTA